MRNGISSLVPAALSGQVTAPGKRPAPRIGVRLRRPLLALAIVFLVGLGTFYGATYLAGHALGTTSSAHSTSSRQTSGQTSATGSSVSSTISESTGSSSAATSTRTFTLSISTNSVSTGTSITVSTSTTSVYTGTSTVTTNQTWPFSLTGSPSVTVSGDEAYLNVNYTYSLNATVRVYEKITLYQGSSGSNEGSTLLTVPPHGGMDLNFGLGRLTPGSYSVVFYVVDFDSGNQLSQSETIQFIV